MAVDAEHGGLVSERAAPEAIVVGAGPAGLMAAETLARAGIGVTIYERMAAPARKLLLAGRGGLNLTHGEPLDRFLGRYGATRAFVEPAVRAWPPSAAVAWCEGLGQPTFTGSSGRVFPKALKASPLLRAWLNRLGGLGVELRLGHRFTGWTPDGAIRFETAAGGVVEVRPRATLLALGGASWPRLGSDGGWVAPLAAAGVALAPLGPSNAGVAIGWSDRFASRFAGQPLKRVAISIGGVRARGEAMVTRAGLEGGAVYALNAPIRAALGRDPSRAAAGALDLRPDLDAGDLARRLARPRGKQSMTTFLRKSIRLSPVDIALMRETAEGELPKDPEDLAAAIKAVPLAITGFTGLERAISSVGGVRRESVDEAFMLSALPGVFVAGEMLDWDAPTGGYLLQATLATAVAAASGMAERLAAS